MKTSLVLFSSIQMRQNIDSCLYSGGSVCLRNTSICHKSDDFINKSKVSFGKILKLPNPVGVCV